MRPRVHFASAASAPTAQPPGCLLACLVPASLLSPLQPADRLCSSPPASPSVYQARTSENPALAPLPPLRPPPSQPHSPRPRHVDRSARFDQCPSPTLIFDQSINQSINQPAAGRPSSQLCSALLDPCPARPAACRPPAAGRTASTPGLTDPSPTYYTLLNRPLRALLPTASVSAPMPACALALPLPCLALHCPALPCPAPAMPPPSTAPS